jgi:membrane dipeptidase
MQFVFDGHNDVLLRLWNHERDGNDPIAEFFNGTDVGHIDAPRARAGGLAGGICAIYVPSGDLVFADPDKNGNYVTPLAAPLERLPSLGIATEMAAIALRLDQAGAWRLCRTVKDIRQAMADGIFAAVMHMEGCEAIGADLAALEVFYAAGLRSLGPVWSRHNVFGHGVPFAFPMSPDTAPGLTDAGFALVRECNRLGILIDLAHITEKGFWDVAKTTEQPLVASHSNAHALTPVARNLTDRQLDAIRESRGLVGVNYATAMLRPDGRSEGDTPLSDIVRHINYLVNRVGIDCVGLGSDFDGATIPDEIGDASGNQRLIAALKDVGYGDADLTKLASENWLRILASAWGEEGA